jgi:hypothetical protein
MAFVRVQLTAAHLVSAGRLLPLLQRKRLTGFLRRACMQRLIMPEPRPTDALEVQALGARLFLTTFRGKVTMDMSNAALPHFSRIVEPMRQPIWLSDAMELTGFEPKSLSLGARWFMIFRRSGGTHLLVASRWERSIMAARTMALGLGVRVRGFSSLEQATAAAESLLEVRAEMP